MVSHWRRVVSLPRDSDVSPQVGCLLPCGALRVYAALKDARSSFDTAVRVRGFANLLVVAGDSVDGLELWTVLLVKNVLCNRNVKVQHSCLFPLSSTYPLLISSLYCPAAYSLSLSKHLYCVHTKLAYIGYAVQTCFSVSCTFLTNTFCVVRHVQAVKSPL